MSELAATQVEHLVPDAADAPLDAPPRGRRGSWLRLALRPAVLAVVLGVLYIVVSKQSLDSVEARFLNRTELTDELVQHIKLSVVATLITIAIAIPLGIVLTRQGTRAFRPVGLGLGNLGQAIPSIGLVVILAEVIGVGFSTAVIALVVYAVLPVLRNTMVGLEGVDPFLVEAARGMGMSRLAVLGRVELPLAVPVILAGVRTALVLTFASAVLATFIDGGGLGGGLVTGIGLNRPLLSVTFGVIVACLALFADWLGLVAEEVLRPRGI